MILLSHNEEAPHTKFEEHPFFGGLFKLGVGPPFCACDCRARAKWSPHCPKPYVATICCEKHLVPGPESFSRLQLDSGK